MRTIVDLPEDQVAALKRRGERSKQSRAELVRKAVAAYLRDHEPDLADEAFGIWRDDPRDGLDFQRRLRGEWSE